MFPGCLRTPGRSLDGRAQVPGWPACDWPGHRTFSGTLVVKSGAENYPTSDTADQTITQRVLDRTTPPAIRPGRQDSPDTDGHTDPYRKCLQGCHTGYKGRLSA